MPVVRDTNRTEAVERLALQVAKGAGRRRSGSASPAFRIPEQPLGEIHPFGELADIPTQGDEFFDHFLRQVAVVGLVLGIPAQHSTPLSILEPPAGDHDHVHEVPDAEPAKGADHQDAGAGLAHVEAMGTEDAQHHGEDEGDTARLV
jgi:hypothetical protein